MVVFLIATSRSQLFEILAPGNNWINLFRKRRAHYFAQTQIVDNYDASEELKESRELSELDTSDTTPASYAQLFKRHPSSVAVHPILFSRRVSAVGEADFDQTRMQQKLQGVFSKNPVPWRASMQYRPTMNAGSLDNVIEESDESVTTVDDRASQARGPGPAQNPRSVGVVGVCEALNTPRGQVLKRNVTRRVQYQRYVSKFYWDESYGREEELSPHDISEGLITGTDFEMKKQLKDGRYPSVLQGNSGHLVVLAVGEHLSQQLVAFIKPLRDDFLVVWREIVIVSKFYITTEPFSFPGVHHIQGDPMSLRTLRQAQVQDAFKVVILDGAPPTFEPNYMDQRTILCNGVLESYLQRFPHKRVSRMTVLHNPNSIKQLVGDAIPTGLLDDIDDDGVDRRDRQTTKQEMKAKSRFQKAFENIKLSRLTARFTIRKSKRDFRDRLAQPVFPPDLHPHFVSSCSIALPDIVRFVAHAFHTPGVMELIQAFLTPGCENMPAMPWILALEDDLLDCQTWNELARWCMKQGVIPLALFRRANKTNEPEPNKDPNSDCAYVVTNPPKDSIPTTEDKMIVLASPRWAYVHCCYKDIIEIFNANRNSLNMLEAFLHWHQISRKTSRQAGSSDKLEEKKTRQMTEKGKLVIKQDEFSRISFKDDLILPDDLALDVTKGAGLDVISERDSLFSNVCHDSPMSVQQALSEANLINKNLLFMHQQMMQQLKLQQEQISHILEKTACVSQNF